MSQNSDTPANAAVNIFKIHKIFSGINRVRIKIECGLNSLFLPKVTDYNRVRVIFELIGYIILLGITMIFSMDIIFFDIDIEEVIFFILGKITIFCLRWLWRSDLRSPGQNRGRLVTFNFSHESRPRKCIRL